MKKEHLKSGAKEGFTYLIEVISKSTGKILDSEIVKNIIPLQGINHQLDVTLNGATQITSWYLGLYENPYNPQTSDTAATFPAAAGESTAYDEATRVLFESGNASGGVSDNSTNRAEFTFNATKTISGGFIISSATKGAATGILLSAVRFASPKQVDNDSILRVTAGLQLTSA